MGGSHHFYGFISTTAMPSVFVSTAAMSATIAAAAAAGTEKGGSVSATTTQVDSTVFASMSSWEGKGGRGQKTHCKHLQSKKGKNSRLRQGAPVGSKQCVHFA